MFKAAVTTSFLMFATGSHAEPVAYDLRVDGLACPFCVYGLEKRLSSIEGAERIEADLKEGKVVVTVKEGVNLSEREVRQAVTEAGFTLRAFSRQASP